MSTISVTASAHIASVPRIASTRLRLTQRGRRVLAVLVALPLAVALSVAVLASGNAVASQNAGVPSSSFETITVQPGDSLWAIAGRIAPSSDPRDVVSSLAKLNNISGGVISAGESLFIPLEYSSAE